MIERLTFNHGASFLTRPQDETATFDVPGPPTYEAPPGPPAAAPTAFVLPTERPDLAYWGALTFTALLFFRPQDSIGLLAPLHLSEVVAIVSLLALAVSRLSAGQPLLRLTPELIGVLGLGAVMVATAPFSIWPGGAFNSFLDVYLKVALIFVLLTHSIRSPEMLRRMTWLIVLAMGYVALRGVADYARGLNLVEGGRLIGPIAGLMGNPNDFAMNMVTFLPFAIFTALGRESHVRRILAAVIAALMIATIVFTKSRAGLLGLGVMGIVLVMQAGRLRAGLLMAVFVGSLIAVPTLPSSIWTRLSSIVNQDEDATGSRQARKELMAQGWRTFLDRPLTGVGVNQFKNYNPPERSVMWQETHNVVLQVLAELGIVGGSLFVFLILTPVPALIRTRRLLPRERPSRRETSASRVAALAFRPVEAEWMRLHTAAATAAFAGWFTCAQFASIGYYWTFYYLLALIVAGREIARDRTRLVHLSATGGHQGGRDERAT
jgi:O-antigen ligase